MWCFHFCKKKKKTKNKSYEPIEKNVSHSGSEKSAAVHAKKTNTIVKNSLISNKNNNQSTCQSAQQNTYTSPYTQRTLNTGSAFDTEFKNSSAPKVYSFTDAKLFNAGSSGSNANVSSTSTASVTKSTNPNTKKKPGCAYIFNHKVFVEELKLDTRIGTEHDEKALCDTFKQYKLKIEVINDATLEKIKKKVKEIKNEDYSRRSCIVIVILSHGQENNKVAAKDEIYSIHDTIIQPMLCNRTLEGTPKLFFIQACKGSNKVGGVYMDNDNTIKTPMDTLMFFASFEGFVSYRQPTGSIFIQTLCDCLQNFGKEKNIIEIVDMVMESIKSTNRYQAAQEHYSLNMFLVIMLNKSLSIPVRFHHLYIYWKSARSVFRNS